MDLGVSAPQLEQAERGFSFQLDGPLDMRMDQRQSLTAARIINETSVEELARIFRNLGGERQSRRVAKMIEHERRERPIETTRQLARVLERLRPRGGQRLHPATRVFQALRLVVNDEIGCLERGLRAVWTRLKAGGRLAVITFHSVEDRVVKDFGRLGARAYRVAGEADVPELRQPCEPELKWVTKKAIRPGAAERAANPRSRSAQLRIFERIHVT
jgi:16S rRNA (cytosine1402-N4)-methyltransferase